VEAHLHAMATVNGEVLFSSSTTNPWVSMPDLSLGWTEPDHILRGSMLWSNVDMISLVNLFPHSISVSADEVAGIQCGQAGSLVAWNVSRWLFDHRFPQLAKSHKLPISTICPQADANRSVLLALPVLIDFETALTLCSQLTDGSGQLASFANLTEWQTIWDLFYKDQDIEGVFMPYRRIKSDNPFLNVYDQQGVLSIPWNPGQPNNGNENCVSGTRSGCNNEYCSVTLMAICSFTGHPPRLILRGNCLESEIGRHFYAQRGSNNNDLVWMGLTGTFIQYESNEKHWVARKLGSDAWAVSRAPHHGLLLGTSTWMLFENHGCTLNAVENRTLSLTSCGLTEFNCDNGDCVLLESRCDGIQNCEDGSDEKGCGVLQSLDDYNKAMSPARPQLTAAVDLLNILKLDESNSKIRLKLCISLEWFDDRLHFLNLRAERAQNSLTADEAAEIWQPQLIFDNMELTDFDLNVEPAITVVHNASYVYYLNGLNEIYNAHVYDGSANKLLWSETVRSDI
jgi:hypothetical protein